jgi:hypothetical protein
MKTSSFFPTSLGSSSHAPTRCSKSRIPNHIIRAYQVSGSTLAYSWSTLSIPRASAMRGPRLGLAAQLPPSPTVTAREYQSGFVDVPLVELTEASAWAAIVLFRVVNQSCKCNLVNPPGKRREHELTIFLRHLQH